jgi:transposase InsO family protein
LNRRTRCEARGPNALWVSDLTDVAAWSGFAYVAFIIDAYVRRIVGWRVSRTAHAGFVLDTLEQALHERRPLHRGGLVHHSDRGSEYLSIRYTERLAHAGIEPSVGSVGNSHDTVLAESINGLYKSDVIHQRGPWHALEAAEFAALGWVDRLHRRRLLEPIGNISPAEAETHYYAAQENLLLAAPLKPHGLRQVRRGSFTRPRESWSEQAARRGCLLACRDKGRPAPTASVSQVS